MFAYIFFFLKYVFYFAPIGFFRRTLKTVDGSINDADSYSQVTDEEWK